MANSYSFYGGQPGQSFTISEIFETKVAAVGDLNKQWKSPLGVSEFVIISYGADPDSETYQANRTIDVNAYGNTYSNTLWQKIYLEKDEYNLIPVAERINYIFRDVESESDLPLGFAYHIIMDLTSVTPELEFSLEQENADAFGPVYMTADDDSTLDNPKYTIHMPRVPHIFSFSDSSIIPYTATNYATVTSPEQTSLPTQTIGSTTYTLSKGDIAVLNTSGTIYWISNITDSSPYVITACRLGCLIPQISTESSVAALDSTNSNIEVDSTPDKNNGSWKLTFGIPRGSRIREIDSPTAYSAAGLTNGDSFIVTGADSDEYGYLYYIENNTAVKKGSIMGPAGSVTPVAYYAVSITDADIPNEPNDSEHGLRKLIDNIVEPNSGEVIVVYFTITTDSGIEYVSYWYGLSGGTWFGTRMTGGSKSLFIDTTSEPTTNTAYTSEATATMLSWGSF